MKRLRRIGILGGMGPEATILLQQRLLACVAATDDADHIPLIIDMNPQVPSRIDHLIAGSGADPAPVLVQMAQGLEQVGAEALAMPCNTAHHYAAQIVDAVSVPLLNMVELSADLVAETVEQGGTIGMLASPAVQRTGLFDKALARRSFKVIWPKDEMAMLNAIRQIKAEGACSQAQDIVGAASDDLGACGASLQLIACSEFSLIAKSLRNDRPTIDTLDVLVNAIKKFSFDS